MPEGDTVWRTAKHLEEAISGQVLTATDFRMPQIATLNLSGERVERTVARGKHLLTYLGAYILHTHLKMEGSWHLYRPGSNWQRPAHQARVVLTTNSWQAVGFSLGITELWHTRDLPATEPLQLLTYLGPDLLGPAWDESQAVAKLLVDPARPIGEALLDQRNLAGIGNLYKNELCFLTGVHPSAPTSAVADLARLVARAKQLLEANKERTAQATTGDLRKGRQHWVYRRERQPCRRCGAFIRYTGDSERASWWCPRCQYVPSDLV
ncbi:MAG: DNA-formamidopyrimidine glycosylase family protein [Candidatus Nanopelagicales bacterium]